jgi:hypothetical protein
MRRVTITAEAVMGKPANQVQIKAYPPQQDDATGDF